MHKGRSLGLIPCDTLVFESALERKAKQGTWHLQLTQLDQANAGNSLNLAKRFNSGVGRGRVGNIDLHYGKCLPLRNTLRANGTSKSKIRDINRVLSKDSSDAPNHTRNVMVPNGYKGSVERSFNVDTIIGQQARRATVQDCRGSARITIGGMKNQLENRTCAACAELLLVLLDTNTAFLR